MVNVVSGEAVNQLLLHIKLGHLHGNTDKKFIAAPLRYPQSRQ